MFGCISRRIHVFARYTRCENPIWSLRSAEFHVSRIELKKKAASQKSKHPSASQIIDNIETDDTHLEEFKKQLEDLSAEFQNTLVSHCSIRTDLQTFSNLQVSLADEQSKPLSHIAQVNRKNARLIQILVNNPTHVRHVRDALDNSALNINPQVEGNVISLPIVPVTREHRESLVKNAKQLYNQFNTDANKSFAQHIARLTRLEHSGLSKDEMKAIEKSLLALKKVYDLQAKELVNNMTKDLLTEQ